VHAPCIEEGVAELSGTSRCPFCSSDVGSSFVYLASMASTTLGCVLPLVVTCFVLPWCASARSPKDVRQRPKLAVLALADKLWDVLLRESGLHRLQEITRDRCWLQPHSTSQMHAIACCTHAAAMRRYSASASQAILAEAYLGSAKLLRGYYSAVLTASQRAAGHTANQVCCGAGVAQLATRVRVRLREAAWRAGVRRG